MYNNYCSNQAVVGEKAGSHCLTPPEISNWGAWQIQAVCWVCRRAPPAACPVPCTWWGHSMTVTFSDPGFPPHNSPESLSGVTGRGVSTRSEGAKERQTWVRRGSWECFEAPGPFSTPHPPKPTPASCVFLPPGMEWKRQALEPNRVKSFGYYCHCWRKMSLRIEFSFFFFFLGENREFILKQTKTSNHLT